jgi:hypothetical protein
MWTPRNYSPAGCAGPARTSRPPAGRSPAQLFGLLLSLGLALAACQAQMPQPVIPAGTPALAATATSVANTASPTLAPITATSQPSPKAAPPATETATLPDATAVASSTAAAKNARILSNGPHLFIDDYLVAWRDQVSRRVNIPRRTLPTPLITGINKNGDDNFDFNTIVLRDGQNGQFQMWHTAFDTTGRQEFTAYSQSTDGTHWTRPFSEVPGTRNAPFVDVFDRGPGLSIPGERYFAITTNLTGSVWVPNLLVSADAQHWTAAKPKLSVPMAYGEIWRIFSDVTTGGFGLLHRWNQPYNWTDAQGTRHQNTVQDPTFVRLFAISSSLDLRHLSGTRVIFEPDRHDPGETQFYAVSNVLRRGDYYLTMLDILRNDLSASDVPAEVHSAVLDRNLPTFGTGYTVLAWSRDGQTWFRDRETDPYFLPAQAPSAWDHAMAWITSLVPVGDAVYAYYGGYQYGHKVYSDRQIGLVKIVRDRYVAQVAGKMPGTLRTPLLIFQASGLTLNVDIGAGGQASVTVLAADGRAVPGFGPGDCAALKSGGLDVPVLCSGNFSSLAGQPVALQFNLTSASLYAFDLLPDRAN